MSSEPSTILVPVDFAPASRRAVEHAIAMAKALGWRVRILHVVPPTAFPEGTRLLPVDASEPVDVGAYVSARARRLLDETFVGLLAAGIEVAREARCGHPAETILRAIEEEGASLVVLGTHGRRGVERVFLGSVAEEVMRRSPVPVLVVRDGRAKPVLAGRHALAGATTLSGAVAGAAVGALAGPPGILAGGAMGTLVGAVAGRTVAQEERRSSAHQRELDAVIGVTEGSLGVPESSKRNVA